MFWPDCTWSEFQGNRVQTCRDFLRKLGFSEHLIHLWAFLSFDDKQIFRGDDTFRNCHHACKIVFMHPHGDFDQVSKQHAMPCELTCVWTQYPADPQRRCRPTLTILPQAACEGEEHQSAVNHLNLLEDDREEEDGHSQPTGALGNGEEPTRDSSVGGKPALEGGIECLPFSHHAFDRSANHQLSKEASCRILRRPPTLKISQNFAPPSSQTRGDHKGVWGAQLRPIRWSCNNECFQSRIIQQFH